MNQKLNRFARVFAPLCVCFVVVLFCAMPASAASTFPAGTWVINDDPFEPGVSFLVNISFTSPTGSYKGLIFREPTESFQYSALYGINTDGSESRFGYWIGTDFYWQSYESRVMVFKDPIVVSNMPFFGWFVINAKQAIEDNPDPWGDLSQDQIDSVVDILQQNKDDIGSIEDAYGKLPLPNVNPDDYSISLWLETEYQAFVSCLAVFWENSLVMNIVAILGALLLVSYLVFGSK